MVMPRKTLSPTRASGTLIFLTLTLLLLLAKGQASVSAATLNQNLKYTSAGRFNVPMTGAIEKRSIPDHTISKVFFYNPPAGDAPPPDVLQMLEQGQTFGNHNPFSTRSFVVANDEVPTEVEFPTSDPLPVALDIVNGSEIGIEVKDNTENYFEVANSLDSSALDDIAKNNTSTPEQKESSDKFQDFITDLPTIPNSRTEVPVEFATTTEILNEEETTTVTDRELTADFTDIGKETMKNRENIDITETTEKYDFAPTTKTFEMTTGDEIEAAETTDLPVKEVKTTVLSLVTASQQDLGHEEETTILPLDYYDFQFNTEDNKGEMTVPATLDDSQPITADYEEETSAHSETDEAKQNLAELEKTDIPLLDNLQIYTTEEEEEETDKYSNMELLKMNYLTENWNNYNLRPDIEYDEAMSSQRDSEKDMHDKLHQLSAGGLNTIFFTIQDEKDGQLRVKVGKALNYATNKNMIQKQGNYKDNVYQYHFHDPNTGWYKFGYGGDNQWRHEERRADGVVLGRYGWHDTTGQEHATHFVADAKGYRIVQPGQEIVMHVAAPTSLPLIPTVNPTPTTLTTVQPFFTRKPSITSDASSTSAFPLASLSTTVTFASPSLPTGPPKQPDDYSSPVPQVVSYPGTINELMSPPPDPFVVTGRPPIAYPLPHQSVAHRPGSWVYVTPAPQYQESSRPLVRPPYRPYRPYPDRPIKSPFRPVNRPRPKPLRPRPLKPLLSNTNTGSRPTEDSEEEDDFLEKPTGFIPSQGSRPTEDSEEEDDSFEKPTVFIPSKGQGIANSSVSANTDLIGAIQTLFNNPFKYPIIYSSHPQATEENYIPNYPIPSNIPGGSQAETDNEQSSSQNPSSLSSEDLLHFINLINSLKGQGEVMAASPNRPVWSLSPWSSSSIKIPQGPIAATGPNLPSSALRPPSSSFTSPITTVHDVFQAHQNKPHYPLDYAFMDEDYVLPNLNPQLNSGGVQIKPAGSNNVEDNFVNVKPDSVAGTSYFTRIPGRPTGTNAITQTMNENPSSSDYIGSVVWKLPVLGPLEVETPVNTQTQVIETDNGVSITVDKYGLNSSTTSDIEENKPQNIKDTGISSTSETPSSSASPSTASVLTSSPSTLPITPSSEAPEPPATDIIWPYISTQPSNISTPNTNITTTGLPPPPPPQNFWTELLKRIYYWPLVGKEGLPTIQ